MSVAGAGSVQLFNKCIINHLNVDKLFPLDEVDCVWKIKKVLGGIGTGTYSHLRGVWHFQDDIVEFIKTQDNGVLLDLDLIFMTNRENPEINMVILGSSNRFDKRFTVWQNIGRDTQLLAF